MSVPETQYECNKVEAEDARSEVIAQRFFDARDDLAQAVLRAQRKNEELSRQLKASPFAGRAEDVQDLQQREDLLLILERYADLATFDEDADIIGAALRLSVLT